MSKITIFIQVQGKPGAIEAELFEAATIAGLHEALAAAGVPVGAEMRIFIDEAEEPLHGERNQPAPGLKHGSRIHACHCHRIKTTAHYLEKTAEHSFPPGKRVRAVKHWAVDHFTMDAKDAAEHVLQICGSSDRPTSDTPLHQLVNGHHCAVCFDLVPDKRVEG